MALGSVEGPSGQPNGLRHWPVLQELLPLRAHEEQVRATLIEESLLG